MNDIFPILLLIVVFFAASSRKIYLDFIALVFFLSGLIMIFAPEAVKAWINNLPRLATNVLFVGFVLSLPYLVIRVFGGGGYGGDSRGSGDGE